MDKSEFYKEQALKFRDYAGKYPERELLSLFEEWAESKDIYGVDKHYIWKIARHFRNSQRKEIEKGSEEAVRISELINAVFGADLERLKKIAEKKETK
jgi:hypothetical protein